MTSRIAVVCEGSTDFRIASLLIDRILAEQISWVADEPANLDYLRIFVGEESGSPFIAWKDISNIARREQIRPRGFLNGRHAMIYAQRARRAILAVRKLFPMLTAVVLLVDQDNQPERRDGLRQARDESGFSTIVLGVAIRSIEAWILSGFEPRNDDERARFNDACRLAGFNIRERSRDLSPKTTLERERNSKVIVDSLMQGTREREEACLTDTPMTSLRQYGQSNGLADFLDEVVQRVVPAIQTGA